MSAVSVGMQAPALRLPAGQGGTIGLEDFRGRKKVIVWFTKGMGCPFCRTQMSQIARGYERIRALDGEVLEIGLSKPHQAKLYVEKFKLPFPYLCDSDYSARKQWGIGYRSRGPIYYAKTFRLAMNMGPQPNDYGDFSPPFAEMPSMLTDDDMGFFIVDRQGILRYSLAGSYMEGAAPRQIPSNDEIFRELERCS